MNGSSQTRIYDQERHLVQITSASTTSTFIYDGNDQRIIQNVTTGATTTHTLYIGNFYEETLTGASSPPYIVYYMFGGKTVGMRRANYPVLPTNTNGQFRVVGDQLGSTTLLIDTAPVPNVTQREYYKPFGEVAFTSGSSRTDKGFTGQRLDVSSGLMYYGARYYDPALSYFISADSTVPEPTLPQSLNRFSYVFNNPLRFVDELGYGPNDYYVFVNGCASPCTKPGEGDPLKYFIAMMGQWLGYTNQFHQQYLDEKWGDPNDWDKWAHEHIKFLTVTDANSGADQLADLIKNDIPQNGGSINLIGHSLGGSAILEYLTRAYETASGKHNWGVTLDPRIKSAVIIDPSLAGWPVGGYARTENGICWTDCNRLNGIYKWLQSENKDFKALVVDTFDAPGAGGGPMAGLGVYGDLPFLSDFGAPALTGGWAERHEWSMENVIPSTVDTIRQYWR